MRSRGRISGLEVGQDSVEGNSRLRGHGASIAKRNSGQCCHRDIRVLEFEPELAVKYIACSATNISSNTSRTTGQWSVHRWARWLELPRMCMWGTSTTKYKELIPRPVVNCPVPPTHQPLQMVDQSVCFYSPEVHLQVSILSCYKSPAEDGIGIWK